MDTHFSIDEILKHNNISGDRMGREEDMSGIPEEQLWMAFQKGSKKAFAIIYKNNVLHLYRYGLTLVNDSDLVMDAIQDFFVGLWESRERLRPLKRTIKPYLYKSVKHKIIARARKRGKLLSLVETEKQLEKSVLSTDPEDVSEREKQLEYEQKELEHALAKLNKKHQQLIHLKFNSGLSYDEIAEVMDMKVRNVYYHMSRAIELLNKYLSHLFTLVLLFYLF